MKKYLIIICMLLLVLPLVSAWEWDNVKDHDKDTDTITITNALGLGDFISNITLKQGSRDKTRFNEDFAAEFKFNSKEAYLNFFQEIEVYEKKKVNSEIGKSLNKNIIFKYYDPTIEWSKERIKETCTESKDYTEALNNSDITCTEEIIITDHTGEWIEYDTSKGIPEGETILRMYINVADGEIIEWIPTFFGKRIDEWTSYIGAYNAHSYTSPPMTAHDGTEGWNMGATRTIICEQFTPVDDIELIGVSVFAKEINTGDVNVTISGVDANNQPNQNVVSENASFDNTAYGSTFQYLNITMPSTTLLASTNYSLCFQEAWTYLAKTPEPKIVNETSSSAAGTTWGSLSIYLGDNIYYRIYTTAPNVAPVTPTLNKPDNMTVYYMANNVVHLNWSNTTDPEGDPITYNIQLANDSGFTTIEQFWGDVAETVNVTDVTTHALNNGTYHWRVNAYDGGYNNSTWSDVWTFNITVVLPEVTSVYPLNSSNFTYNQVNLTYNVTDEDDNIDNCILFLDDVINSTDTTITKDVNQTFNLSFADGSYLWNVQCEDDFGNYDNTSAINFTIDTLAPVVEIDMLTIESYDADLNFTAIEEGSGLNKCWYDIGNGTNTTMWACANVTLDLEYASYFLTLYANDSVGNIGSDTKNFTYVGFTEDYQNVSIEGSKTNLTLKVLKGENVITSSKLTYNFTNYTSNLFATQGYNTTYYNIIQAARSENISSNVPFNWNISFTYDGDTNSLTTANGTNEVYKLVMSEFSGANKSIALNFTLKDELTGLTLTNYTNATIEGTFDIFKETESNNREYSFSFATNNSEQLYIYPKWADYFVNAQVKYNATGYGERNYWLNNISISNISTNISLYLLSIGSSSAITIHVIDNDDVAITDVTVEANKYNVGYNNYTLVQSEQVNFNGEAIFNLDRSEEYLFEVIREGIVIYSSGRFTPTEDDYYFRIQLGEDLPLDVIRNLKTMDYVLGYDNSSAIVSWYYNDLANLTTAGCLEVRKNDPNNDTILHLSCSSTNSANITYTMTETDISFRAIGYIVASSDNENYVLDTLFRELSTRGVIQGSLEGLFWAFMLMLMLGFIGIAIKDGNAIVLLEIVGLVISRVFLIQLSWAVVIGIIIVAIIMLVLINKGRS